MLKYDARPASVVLMCKKMGLRTCRTIHTFHEWWALAASFANDSDNAINIPNLSFISALSIVLTCEDVAMQDVACFLPQTLSCAAEYRIL